MLCNEFGGFSELGVAHGMRELVFDVVGTDAQHFVKDGPRHGPEGSRARSSLP